jgi:hypothetical protein
MKKFIKRHFLAWLVKKNSKKAINKANGLWLTTGKQHFVIKTGEASFTVLNKNSLKKYNKKAKRRGLKEYNHYMITQEATYITPAGTIGERIKKKFPEIPTT